MSLTCNKMSNFPCDLRKNCFLHLPTFRSLAAIVSEKSTVFLFPIEKPELANLTLL